MTLYARCERFGCGRTDIPLGGCDTFDCPYRLLVTPSSALTPERLSKALYEAMKIELPWLTFSTPDIRGQYADGLAERALSLLHQWEQEGK